MFIKDLAQKNKKFAFCFLPQVAYLKKRILFDIKKGK